MANNTTSAQTDSTEIQLSKPIDVAGAKLSTLRMREPTVADQLAMDKMGGTQAEQEINLMAMLCGLAPTDLHTLGMRDYKKLQKAYQSFTD